MEIKYYDVVEIEGPREESTAAFDWLADNNYEVVRSGPKPSGPFMVDLSTFQIQGIRPREADKCPVSS